MTVNRLPAPTWKWMKVNEARVSVSGENFGDTSEYSDLETVRQIPDGVEYSGVVCDDLAGMETGMGSDMCALMNSEGVQRQVYTLNADTEAKTPLKLTFPLKSGKGFLGQVGIRLGRNSRLNVIMDCTTDTDDGSSFTALQTLAHLEAGSSLCLVQIMRPGQKSDTLNDLGIVCDDGAKASVISLVLGGGNTAQGCLTRLSGMGSSLDMSVGYLLGMGSSLDMNYIARHEGRKSRSQMDFAGVLRGNAKKLLRYTLDFVRGAVNSCGDEKEDVLLMDDGVVNQTVPLILCGEENVEGNHGATIGRVGEDLVFYMESRGMRREDIYEMMAKGRIGSIIRLIPDDETRDELTRYLDRM